MTRRRHLIALACACTLAAPLAVQAQADTVKIGVILPMTGQSASTGKQIAAAIQLFQAQNGKKAGGKTVEVLIKDDAGVADNTRRLAQELVVNDKVVALAGFGLTPLALATAPIATQSKTPMVVMAAATSSITEASPYITRTSFTLPQAAVAMGDWAPKNGIKRVVTLVADYGPGNDAEKYFADRILLNSGHLWEVSRTSAGSWGAYWRPTAIADSWGTERNSWSSPTSRLSRPVDSSKHGSRSMSGGSFRYAIWTNLPASISRRLMRWQ